jgi:hypothetical protein
MQLVVSVTESEQLVSLRHQNTSCFASTAGAKCDRHSSCINGTLVNALLTCNTTNIPELQQCGGVGFDSNNPAAIGRCVNVSASKQPLHCIKTSATQAHCMTADHWRRKFNKTVTDLPEVISCWTEEDKSIDPYGGCCETGSTVMITGNGAGSICCPWRIGQAADGSGPACCPEVDACNICSGKGKQLDANGVLGYCAMPVYMCLSSVVNSLEVHPSRVLIHDNCPCGLHSVLWNTFGRPRT